MEGTQAAAALRTNFSGFGLNVQGDQLPLGFSQGSIDG